MNLGVAVLLMGAIVGMVAVVACALIAISNCELNENS